METEPPVLAVHLPSWHCASFLLMSCCWAITWRLVSRTFVERVPSLTASMPRRRDISGAAKNAAALLHAVYMPAHGVYFFAIFDVEHYNCYESVWCEPRRYFWLAGFVGFIVQDLIADLSLSKEKASVPLPLDMLAHHTLFLLFCFIQMLQVLRHFSQPPPPAVAR